MFNVFVGLVLGFSVVDGDTIDIQARVWPNILIHERVRILGVDTPELHGKTTCERLLASKAKQFTFDTLSIADKSGKKIEVHVKPGNDERDGFGRILADVYVDGISLKDTLIANRVGRSYGGSGAKQPWC